METANQPQQENEQHSSFLGYFVDIFRPGKKKTRNFNLRIMHRINLISIMMFIICLGVLIFRWMSK